MSGYWNVELITEAEYWEATKRDEVMARCEGSGKPPREMHKQTGRVWCPVCRKSFSKSEWEPVLWEAPKVPNHKVK